MKKNKHWKQLSSTSLLKTKYFELSVDQCEMQSGKIVPKYFVMDFPDWVQVVAKDEQNNLILVYQYRYPAAGDFLEFPGGSTHAGKGEDAKLAAQRELLEETGYESSSWQYLGFHYPNPALFNNKCHVYLALNCTKTSPQSLDPFEVLDVVVLSAKEFLAQLNASDKKHALMLATLQIAMPHL